LFDLLELGFGRAAQREPSLFTFVGGRTQYLDADRALPWADRLDRSTTFGRGISYRLWPNGASAR
jgi:hypothetical protein